MVTPHSRLSILALTPTFPYPPVSGGDIRSFHLLKRLAQRFSVHLCSAQPGDRAALLAETTIAHIAMREHDAPTRAARRPATFSFWSGAPHGISMAVDPRVHALVARQVESHRFDAVLIDHLYMMQYVKAVGPLPVFYMATDVETTKFARWYRGEPATRRRRLLRWAQRRVITFHESRLHKTTRAVFTTSIPDSETLARLNGRGRFVAVPNGVDLQYFQPRPIDSFEGPPALLFIGTMYYKPNHDAAVYLANLLMPELRREVPGVICHLAGKTGDDAFAELHQPERGVQMHGFVTDVRPFMTNAQVLVAPLFAGSGTRIKILEAMASGTPVVSSTIGAEGIEYTDGENIIIADGLPAQTRALVALLGNRVRAAAIGAAGRRLVERSYSWDRSAEILATEIAGALARSPRRQHL